MRRDFVDRLKAAIVDLLHAAGLIERYDIDKLLIIEMRDGRIVKCDVTVLSDPKEHQIHRMLPEDLRIAKPLRFDILSSAI